MFTRHNKIVYCENLKIDQTSQRNRSVGIAVDRWVRVFGMGGFFIWASKWIEREVIFPTPDLPQVPYQLHTCCIHLTVVCIRQTRFKIYGTSNFSTPLLISISCDIQNISHWWRYSPQLHWKYTNVNQALNPSLLIFRDLYVSQAFRCVALIWFSWLSWNNIRVTMHSKPQHRFRLSFNSTRLLYVITQGMYRFYCFCTRDLQSNSFHVYDTICQSQ